ncbi:hypothetical protein AKJ16_DCAP19225, partial [Drosera capensis]
HHFGRLPIQDQTAPFHSPHIIITHSPHTVTELSLDGDGGREPRDSIGREAEPRLISDAANPSATNRQEVQDSSVPPAAKKPASQRDAVVSVAARIVAQPLPCSDPDVWGVLTAISNNARKRTQGINMLLSANEHSIGRTVEDTRFQIESNAVSQRHCKIFRRRVVNDGDKVRSGSNDSVYLIDTSTNGTYINWERLKRGSSKVKAKLDHGDIISFVGPPHYGKSIRRIFHPVNID